MLGHVVEAAEMGRLEDLGVVGMGRDLAEPDQST